MRLHPLFWILFLLLWRQHTCALLLAIEGSLPGSFLCPNCGVLLQQEWIQQQVLRLVPSATIAATNHKLANVLFVDLPEGVDPHVLTTLDGVVRVLPSVPHQPHSILDAVEYVGGASPEVSCRTGRGVRVAVLDSGIDYTHAFFGGPGTVEAHRQAYGTSADDVANTQRDNLFPTAVVVDGADFVGDQLGANDPDELAQPDDDPIDGINGHGTLVAGAVLAAAPHVELVAVKVCVTDTVGGCPESAILAGLEYVLDPNGDGVLDDAVDIVNVSLGRRFSTTYYSVLSNALENVFALGVLVVVASGNSGNVPFIAGGISTTPNALSVGATTVPEEGAGVAATYSSRGPGDNNTLKPDLSVPGGFFTLPAAGSGTGSVRARGTSFSAPLAAGLAAVVKEVCPTCSPFAIKALLVNNVRRDIRYSASSDELAPLSFLGAGEAKLDKTIAADFWAYSIEDVQPSISLGLINVAEDMLLTRTIRVTSLLDGPQTLNAAFEFRSPVDRATGAMEVTISPAQFDFNACGEEQLLQVTIRIMAANVPLNHMVGAGESAFEPTGLDLNEFDGWVVIGTAAKDIVVPLHSILRRSSRVEVANPWLVEQDSSPWTAEVGLRNTGAATAQVDVYELIYTSQDDAESPRGTPNPPSDFRYIGYRTIPGYEDDCGYVIEIAYSLWESIRTPATNVFYADFDWNDNFSADTTLFNDGPVTFGSATYIECRLSYLESTGVFSNCTGFTPDHATNSGNIIMRACSSDMGVEAQDIDINYAVSFETRSIPTFRTADLTFTLDILFPNPALSSRSFDLLPGEEKSALEITGLGTRNSLGLLLITNGYRSPTSTGAATRDTEAIAILFEGVPLFEEITPEVESLLPATVLNGPSCSWGNRTTGCSARRLSDVSYNFSSTARLPLDSDGIVDPLQTTSIAEALVCDARTVPRFGDPTPAPTSMPTGPMPSSAPSLSSQPSMVPSISFEPSPEGTTDAPSFAFIPLSQSPTAGSDEVGIRSSAVSRGGPRRSLFWCAISSLLLRLVALM